MKFSTLIHTSVVRTHTHALITNCYSLDIHSMIRIHFFLQRRTTIAYIQLMVSVINSQAKQNEAVLIVKIFFDFQYSQSSLTQNQNQNPKVKNKEKKYLWNFKTSKLIKFRMNVNNCTILSYFKILIFLFQIQWKVNTDNQTAKHTFILIQYFRCIILGKWKWMHLIPLETTCELNNEIIVLSIIQACDR